VPNSQTSGYWVPDSRFAASGMTAEFRGDERSMGSAMTDTLDSGALKHRFGSDSTHLDIPADAPPSHS